MNSTLGKRWLIKYQKQTRKESTIPSPSWLLETLQSARQEKMALWV